MNSTDFSMKHKGSLLVDCNNHLASWQKGEIFLTLLLMSAIAAHTKWGQSRFEVAYNLQNFQDIFLYSSTVYGLNFYKIVGTVQIFWEGHKIWKKIFHRFLKLLSTRRSWIVKSSLLNNTLIFWDIFSNFCGLLIIFELYSTHKSIN